MRFAAKITTDKAFHNSYSINRFSNYKDKDNALVAVIGGQGQCQRPQIQIDKKRFNFFYIINKLPDC